MAAFSASVSGAFFELPQTGLRPEPQGVATLAADAALEFGAEPKSRTRHGKSVFDRHSTQSSIAGRKDPEPSGFKALVVDDRVYSEAAAVYKSDLLAAQVSEYAPPPTSTAAATKKGPHR
jgi:hypothetical protein